MTQLTRGWLAFAAIGAAVIHLALLLGSPLPLAIPLGLLGAVEFGWGIVTLSRDRVPFARVARFVAIVPAVAWSLLVVLATALDAPGVASGFNVIPMAVATVFELFIAAAISRSLRRPTAPALPPRRYFLGLVIGALVVLAITAPALAFTQVGVANSGSTTYEFSDPGHIGH